LQELGRRCAEIDERWQETLVSLEKKEKQLKEVQRERDEEQGKMRDACKVAAFHSEQLHELDQYCKQLDAQLIKKDQELIECRQKLKHDESKSFEQNTELNILQQKLQCMESKSMEVQGRLAEKEDHIQKLHRQLARKETRTVELRGQVHDLEQQLDQLKQDPSNQVMRLKSAQAQLLQKDQELCELQEQLAEELAKRQEFQYNAILRERTLVKLQEMLSDAHHNRTSSFQGRLSVTSECGSSSPSSSMRGHTFSEVTPSFAGVRQRMYKGPTQRTSGVVRFEPSSPTAKPAAPTPTASSETAGTQVTTTTITTSSAPRPWVNPLCPSLAVDQLLAQRLQHGSKTFT